MTTPNSPSSDSPLATVFGEPRARRVIRELLAHLQRVRAQPWISLDFPDGRIQSRPAVHAIALEDGGRATAIQHISIEPAVPKDEGTDRFLAAIAPLEKDRTLAVPGFHIDIAVSLGFGPVGLDMKLLANGLRGWSVRQFVTAPAGVSTHVITVSGTPVRLQLEKTACLEGPGQLSIFRAELPATFGAAVTEGLRARLHTLLQTSADRHVLLFEKPNRLWGVAHLRMELEASSFEFPELSRVHEIWMIDAPSFKLGETPVFRRVLPVNIAGAGA